MKKRITFFVSVAFILATAALLTGCSVVPENDGIIAVSPHTTEITTAPTTATTTESPTSEESEDLQTEAPTPNASPEQTTAPVVVENGTTLDPEKIVPDMSPEAQLERYKADLAKRQSVIDNTNNYYESLLNRRDKLLSTAGGERDKLSKNAAEELALIESRIKNLEFNQDIFLDDQNFYNLENVFLNNIPSSLERCIKNQKGMKEGSKEWQEEQAYIEMYTEMIRMYENGESMDDIYLYNFEQLNKMQGRYELTPESMLLDYKADLAKFEADRVELVNEVEELTARRDALLRSAGGDASKLSEAKSEDLAATNERLDTIYLNSGNILNQPDMYAPEVYFLTQTKANLEGAQWTIKGQTPGTADYARTQAYIDTYTKCLEMYDAGEELDDILLYNFSQVLYINSAEFGE